jgi:hypothetical protein
MNIEPSFVTDVEVVSVNQRERSTVHSSTFGGGGLTYKGTGFNVPVNVQTTHESWLEVWVRCPDGTEDRLTFSDENLPVREGHRLAVLLSSTDIWAVKNFSTGVTTRFVGAENLVKPMKRFSAGWLIPRLWLLVFGVFIVGNVAGLRATSIGNLVSLTTIGCCAFPVYFTLKSKKRWKSEMAEARRLLAEGLAALENA